MKSTALTRSNTGRIFSCALHAPTAGNMLGGLVILAFPMAGAYAGMALRLAYSSQRRA